jgi:hypothetical protein
MAPSLERKKPGVFGIIIGAVLSTVLGALLGVLHLASQRVEVVAEAPKEPAAGTRYFITGEPPKDSGRSMERKLDQLENPGAEVAFSEGELNAWSHQTFKPTQLEEAEKNGAVMIVAGRPNFRFVGKELQLGMENELVVFGSSAPLVLQARGGFEHAGDKMRFKASEAYLGALPLHRLPAGVLEAVGERFAPVAPKELAAVLDQASAISVADGQLIVRLR